MNKEDTTTEQLSKEKIAAVHTWLEIIDFESLLPVVNKEVLRENLVNCAINDISPAFVITLCPVFENIPDVSDQG